MAELCKELERLGDENALATTSALNAELGAEFERVKTALLDIRTQHLADSA